MTPDQAEDFYQDDEDPEKIFAIFDAGEKGVTLPPGHLGVIREASAVPRRFFIAGEGVIYRCRDCDYGCSGFTEDLDELLTVLDRHRATCGRTSC